MSGEAKVRMSRRYISLIKVLNGRLNHFPSHEQRGLALVIRTKAYSLCDHMVEAQKRFHKGTPLGNLDITHEQLRMHLFTAKELGYFRHPMKDGYDPGMLNDLRHQRLTTLVDQFGQLIGGWQKKLKEEKRLKGERQKEKEKAAQAAGAGQPEQ